MFVYFLLAEKISFHQIWGMERLWTREELIKFWRLKLGLLCCSSLVMMLPISVWCGGDILYWAPSTWKWNAGSI